MNDQRYYDIVAKELKDRFIRPGLWARAVAETGSEGSAARAAYIRLRVAELSQQMGPDNPRPQAEPGEQDAKRTDASTQIEERARGPGPIAFIVLVVVGLLVLLLLRKLYPTPQ